MKRFILYLLRWQLSTPILWLVLQLLGVGIWPAILANLIGAVIFFWVDKFIFTSYAAEVWYLQESGVRYKCQRKESFWRLLLAPKRLKSGPIFLCSRCSAEKGRVVDHPS